MGKTFKDSREYQPKVIIREPKVNDDGTMYDPSNEESWTPEAKRAAKRLARRARRRAETHGEDE